MLRNIPFVVVACITVMGACAPSPSQARSWLENAFAPIATVVELKSGDPPGCNKKPLFSVVECVIPFTAKIRIKQTATSYYQSVSGGRYDYETNLMIYKKLRVIENLIAPSDISRIVSKKGRDGSKSFGDDPTDVGEVVSISGSLIAFKNGRFASWRGVDIVQ